MWAAYRLLYSLYDRPKNKSKYTETIDVGQYTHSNYDIKEASTKVKDQDIVNHLSRKFKTNFNMLLSKK